MANSENRQVGRYPTDGRSDGEIFQRLAAVDFVLQPLGLMPRPDQVSPVLGWRYLAGTFGAGGRLVARRRGCPGLQPSGHWSVIRARIWCNGRRNFLLAGSFQLLLDFFHLGLQFFTVLMINPNV